MRSLAHLLALLLFASPAVAAPAPLKKPAKPEPPKQQQAVEVMLSPHEEAGIGILLGALQVPANPPPAAPPAGS